MSNLIHSVSPMSYDSSETLPLQLFFKELRNHTFMLMQTFLEAIIPLLLSYAKSSSLH